MFIQILSEFWMIYMALSFPFIHFGLDKGNPILTFKEMSRLFTEISKIVHLKHVATSGNFLFIYLPIKITHICTEVGGYLNLLRRVPNR